MFILQRKSFNNTLQRIVERANSSTIWNNSLEITSGIIHCHGEYVEMDLLKKWVKV